MKIKQVK